MNILKTLVLFVVLATPAFAGSDLTKKQYTVDGVAREALVYIPAQATSTPCPVVFAFHGHGGHMTAAAKQFNFSKLWPEAISVYPQGLNIPGLIHDPEGKSPGWQHLVGEVGDRDLKLFDAILADLKANYKVDATNIYVTGFSNGAFFSYVLWQARGDEIKAFAPVAGVSPELPKLVPGFKPRPLFLTGGRADPSVKFEWQQPVIDAVKTLNQCSDGKPWIAPMCTIYPSATGCPMVTYLHNGKHMVPPDAPGMIVKFFKSLPSGTPSN